MPRSKVFVSYSHRDRDWLERLLIHLAVLERRQLIYPWSDTRIEVGAGWLEEIQRALGESRVAVLLITPDFLASSFIWTEEMPHIMEHRKQGLEVLPLIVRPCAWRLEEDLAQLQARPADGRPLSTGSDAQIDLDLTAFVYELAARIQMSPATMATQEWAHAEQYRTSPRRVPTSSQRAPMPPEESRQAAPTAFLGLVLGRLPRSWTGHYTTDSNIGLRLIIREKTGRNFQGSIEYLEDGTMTSVEGRVLHEDEIKTDRLWSTLNPSQFSEDQVALRFRETAYEKQGTRQVSFNGEYRAVASGKSMSGAWFSGPNGRLVGSFELELDS